MERDRKRHSCCQIVPGSGEIVTRLAKFGEIMTLHKYLVGFPLLIMLPSFWVVFSPSQLGVSVHIWLGSFPTNRISLAFRWSFPPKKNPPNNSKKWQCSHPVGGHLSNLQKGSRMTSPFPKKKRSRLRMKNHQAFLFHFNRRTCEVIKSTIKATRSSGSSSSKCFQTSVMYRSAPSNPGADVIFDGFPRRTAGGSFRFRLKMGRERTQTLNVTTMNTMEKISQEIYVSMCTFSWVRLRFLRLEKRGNQKHRDSECNQAQTTLFCTVKGGAHFKYSLLKS